MKFNYANTLTRSSDFDPYEVEEAVERSDRDLVTAKRQAAQRREMLSALRAAKAQVV